MYNWMVQKHHRSNYPLPKHALDQLYEETNLAPFLKDPMCDTSLNPYHTGWTQGIYNVSVHIIQVTK